MEEERIDERKEERIYDMKDERTYDMSGLKLAFWGLMFTVINIRIQGFDIVPDVVGYIMVISGLSKIRIYDDHFSSAQKPAYILAALALINIVQVQSSWETWGTGTPADFSSGGHVSYSAGVFGGIPWLAMLFMVVGTLANIYFAYHMCMGMKNLLLRVGDGALAMTCDGRWKLILAAEAGVLVSMLTVMLGIPIGIYLTLVFGVLSLVALVLFLLLVHHARKSIEGMPQPEPLYGSQLTRERTDD